MIKDNHALLPEFIQDVVGLIGYTKAYSLVTHLGGASFHFGKGVHDTKYSRLLTEAVGDDAAKSLCEVYGGTREYIPRCHAAMLMQRNQDFIKEFKTTVAAGNSKNYTMTLLCPKYEISDRTAWSLIKPQISNTQQPLF